MLLKVKILVYLEKTQVKYFRMIYLQIVVDVLDMCVQEIDHSLVS